jgi:hypothetical protein
LAYIHLSHRFKPEALPAICDEAPHEPLILRSFGANIEFADCFRRLSGGKTDKFAGPASKWGHFAGVKGKVLSVHASGATIYLNFERHWTKNFSVIVLRRSRRKFSAAGILPQRLQGDRIRVRGWMEQRSGRVIEADATEQIELIE